MRYKVARVLEIPGVDATWTRTLSTLDDQYHLPIFNVSTLWLCFSAFPLPIHHTRRAPCTARVAHLCPANQPETAFQGQKAGNDDTTLAQAGFKDGMKIHMPDQLLKRSEGSKQSRTNAQSGTESCASERSKPQVKLRSTGPSPAAPSSKYKFHRVAPLPHPPNPASAQKILDKLANDPAILHVIAKHEFSVGLLTELAPHEQPHLLGLNVNAGQEIKLRIRTNAYDEFRLYSEVRRVLCHELTHNVWGDHDENFKELNSKLNREVTQFERDQASGTHYLTSSADPHGIYQPSSELEAEARAYVLGGSSSTASTAALAGDSREDMRRRMLEATMSRLRKEEEEIEMSCGTGTDVKTSEPDPPSGSS
ncbi:hypothetical protein NP233_g5199 [Leucocoprinus birnbaumii]|uniref:WLM domain-containing protein n=1 Tax=Leucocoprinus birnbaumii TaxID=56174 RepID=A0AAD5VUQ1_9AGAR|nr:hypothetical protein NP233_g5199 [Leucocoprinus birnbaumii]